MKLVSFLSAAVAAATVAFGAAPSVFAAEAPIVLRLHHFHSPVGNPQKKFLEPWAKAVEAESGGRLKIEIYPAMQLGGKASELYGQARDGIVDMAWTIPGYTPGAFPLTEVFTLPFLAGSSEATSAALTEFYEQHLKEEYGDTVPLVFHAGDVHALLTKTPVRKMEDLSGLRIRVPDRMVGDAMEALGASAVGIPTPDVYEALQRNLLDGVMTSFSVGKRFKQHEVTNFVTEVPLTTLPLLLTMNKERFDSLPPDLQQVLLSHRTVDYARKLGRIWDEEMESDRAAIADRIELIELSPEQIARWREKLRPLYDAWAERMAGKGVDGKALIADAEALMAKYEGQR